MKNIKAILLTIAAAWMITACQKDGEILVVTAPGAVSDLSADATEIVLHADEPEKLALTLYWNNAQEPTVSNPNVSLPDDLVTMDLQIAADHSFATTINQRLDNGCSSMQFTVAELNNIMLRLGFTDANLHDVYLRMNTSMNNKVLSSELLKLRIAPFIIDMSVMEMQNKDDRSVFAVLRSSDSAPDVYEGFAIAGAWQKFYFATADGNVWGTNALTGKAFDLISTTGSDAGWANLWDCWFTNVSGCNYVYMYAKTAKWEQLHIPLITLTAGDKVVDMKFSASTKSWSGVFTTTTANQALTVGGVGAKYDIETGDSGAPKNSPFSIVAGEDGSFRFATEATDTNLNTGAIGTYTLTLNVESATWQLVEGGGDPVVDYPEALYAYYYYKSASQRLALATAMAAGENEGSYHGFVYTDPAWGDQTSNFRFHTTTDQSAVVYGTNSTQYALSSEASVGNLWSANTGLNYLAVDLATMSWAETKVAQIAVAGDFNSWSTTTDLLQYDAATGKWSATCNIATIGYGFKFILGDAGNAWRWQYGDPDGDGVLMIAGNSDNVVPLVGGTYKIELSLNSYTAPTYTLQKID